MNGLKLGQVLDLPPGVPGKRLTAAGCWLVGPLPAGRYVIHRLDPRYSIVLRRWGETPRANGTGIDYFYARWTDLALRLRRATTNAVPAATGSAPAASAPRRHRVPQLPPTSDPRPVSGSRRREQAIALPRLPVEQGAHRVGFLLPAALEACRRLVLATGGSRVGWKGSTQRAIVAAERALRGAFGTAYVEQLRQAARQTAPPADPSHPAP